MLPRYRDIREMAVQTFAKLDRLKRQLDAVRPLSPEVARNLHEDLVLRWTYHSNAIEGNTLTLKETRVALEGITIGGKTIREHFEVMNHREAILFIEDVVQNREPLSERLIRSIHRLILKNIDDEHAGVYRKVNVTIAGAVHRPPDALHVQSSMEELMNWYDSATAMHPVQRAARLHVDFVGIHPFIDGNGRTARLLMNLELMKNGFPPLIVPMERRLEYYEALDSAHTTQDYDRFLILSIDLAEAAFDPYWYALGLSPD